VVFKSSSLGHQGEGTREEEDEEDPVEIQLEPTMSDDTTLTLALKFSPSPTLEASPVNRQQAPPHAVSKASPAGTRSPPNLRNPVNDEVLSHLAATPLLPL
jgi:hypothetical protein